MSPCYAIDNHGNIGLANAEPARDYPLMHSLRGQPPNFSDCDRVKFCACDTHPFALAIFRHHVGRVFSPGPPEKVLRSVVRRVIVPVKHARLPLNRGDENFGDKPVNQSVHSGSVHRHGYLQMTLRQGA